MADQKSHAFTASYVSATNESFSLSEAIPTPPSGSVADKVAYLDALRKATLAIQDQVNKALTARMEEDKAREASSGPASAAGTKRKKSAVDEDKEEENYGEEVVEDDD